MSDFQICPSGPFSFAQSMDVLTHWDPVRRFAGHDGEVRLSFLLDGELTPAAVTLRERDGNLHVRTHGTRDAGAVRRQVARIFSLDHDGREYPAIGRRDPAIGRLMASLPGLRPVCFPSPYEAAAWAVLSQRISMTQAARLEDRLIAEHGVSVDGVPCFPPPDRLKRVRTGLPAEKITRLHAVAQAAEEGRLDAEKLRTLGDVDGPASLRTIRGIGEFWSQGVYLRACGIRDVFPEEPRARAAAARISGSPERWRPFRMWICFLLRVAGARGLI
jgi:DNA-3-methyladenine glycosylase II